MNEAVIITRLSELTEVMNGTTAPATNNPSNGAYLPQAPKGESMEEALDHLRLQIRYLTFDLEATRRENRYLRQMLDSRPDLGKDDGLKE